MPPRRVLATRNAGWAKTLARWLGQRGVRPNTVSIAGVVFAVGASVAFYLAPELTRGRQAGLLLLAAAAIQLRLLCNLLDGMLAVEEGFKSKTGEIYNDLPDRVADVFILVGAGYSVRSLAFGATLGWAAAALALFTAYVRVLGGSLGVTQHFIGPMAKQHRMFTPHRVHAARRRGSAARHAAARNAHWPRRHRRRIDRDRLPAHPAHRG